MTNFVKFLCLIGILGLVGCVSNGNTPGNVDVIKTGKECAKEAWKSEVSKSLNVESAIVGCFGGFKKKETIKARGRAAVIGLTRYGAGVLETFGKKGDSSTKSDAVWIKFIATKAWNKVNSSMVSAGGAASPDAAIEKWYPKFWQTSKILVSGHVKGDANSEITDLAGAVAQPRIDAGKSFIKKIFSKAVTGGIRGLISHLWVQRKVVIDRVQRVRDIPTLAALFLEESRCSLILIEFDGKDVEDIKVELSKIGCDPHFEQQIGTAVVANLDNAQVLMWTNTLARLDKIIAK